MEYELKNEIQKFINEEQYNYLKERLEENTKNMCFKYKRVRELRFETSNNYYKDDMEFSIRMYDLDLKQIYLVKRVKESKDRLNVIREVKEKVSKTELKNILKGDIDWLNKTNKSMFMELFIQMKYNNLVPKNLYEYISETYKNEDNNQEVVVFNSNIKLAKNQAKDFFVYNLNYEYLNEIINLDYCSNIIMTLTKIITQPKVCTAVLGKLQGISLS